MEILLFVTDIITGINVILIFGAAFLVLDIVMALGKKGGYILATGWRFFLPAVMVFAVIRIYDFFLRYSPVMAFAREMLYLVFSVLLFTAILIQYLAIHGAMEKRM
jgi:hypothetical protein